MMNEMPLTEFVIAPEPVVVREPLEQLVVIVGPTATAKTSLAIQLAQQLGGEIVSADSVQVYRKFDIGSGKPSTVESAQAIHHLVDIRDPAFPLEAHVWAELAVEKINDIRSRGRVPIVCGGTFLWVRALLYGLADLPAASPSIRERHQEIIARRGRKALHDALVRVDPKSAQRLHPNDFVRVSRALEVFEISGRMLSTLQAEHGFKKMRYRAQLVSVEWQREAYEQRLRQRIAGMLAAGWCAEVESLLHLGLAEARAMDAVGYRQVRAAVETVMLAGGSLADIDQEALEEEITRVTRIFARRQRTWLRDEPIHFVPSAALSDSSQLNELVELLRNSA